MNPTETGRLYDKLAPWWNAQQDAATAGLRFVKHAIGLAARRGRALDVGCGSGGRIIHELSDAGFHITGLDVSAALLALAHQRHPRAAFMHADIAVRLKPLPYAKPERRLACWIPAAKLDPMIALRCE